MAVSAEEEEESRPTHPKVAFGRMRKEAHCGTRTQEREEEEGEPISSSTGFFCSPASGRGNFPRAMFPIYKGPVLLLEFWAMATGDLLLLLPETPICFWAFLHPTSQSLSCPPQQQERKRVGSRIRPRAILLGRRKEGRALSSRNLLERRRYGLSRVLGWKWW